MPNRGVFNLGLGASVSVGYSLATVPGGKRFLVIQNITSPTYQILSYSSPGWLIGHAALLYQTYGSSLTWSEDVGYFLGGRTYGNNYGPSLSECPSPWVVSKCSARQSRRAS